MDFTYVKYLLYIIAALFVIRVIGSVIEWCSKSVYNIFSPSSRKNNINPTPFSDTDPSASKTFPTLSSVNVETNDYDHNDYMLDVVSNFDGFKRKKIFNASEAKVFYLINEVLSDEKFKRWHCHGQVSLGELITTNDDDYDGEAYRAINSKRVDFAVVNNFGEPVLIVEYFGEGHFGNDPDASKKRDYLKRIVAHKAGIKVLTLLPEDIQDSRRFQTKQVLAHSLN